MSRAEHGLVIGGRYRVQRQLGEGGMSVVYAVVDQTTDKPLALKLLNLSSSPALRAPFEREYQTLASIHHANIVEVYAYGEDARGPYYTMELLEGSELSKLAPLPWTDVCRYLRDTASILGLLHARRLLHRDLTPRNLWRLPDGRIKLLDFGALTPFGIPPDVMGTPPFIPPEALHGRALDARSDLYALGALGFWLLTGSHAYPAKTLADLPTAWARDLVPPSVVLQQRVGGLVSALPAELDALIDALLSMEPRGRPAGTADVMERLSAIAGLESDACEVAIDGHLESKVFVGREPELALARASFEAARKGACRGLSIEGEPGLGRTRLLEEIAILVRLGGGTLLEPGERSDRPYGVALALSLALLDTAPELALAHGQEHGAVLGHISPVLAARFRVNLEQLAVFSDAPGEARLCILSALESWFLAVSRQRLLVISVDDVQAIDEESAAFLASLAGAAAGHALLLVSTLQLGAGRALSASVERLRALCQRVVLPPLLPEQTHELLRSVFHDTAFLARLADRLHRRASGVPAYCLELAAHLVSSDVVQYVDGIWVLPSDVADSDLPSSREAGLRSRLHGLSEAARTLGRELSVHGGALPRDACLAASQLPREARLAALSELTRSAVLVRSGALYRFAHDALRAQLASELGARARTEAHARWGEALLETAVDGDLFVQLSAGVHLLRGDQWQRGSALVAAIGVQEPGRRPQSVAAIALFEEALTLFRAHGCSRHELISLLGGLAESAYFVDPRLAPRYGDEALETLAAVLHLGLARKLRVFLGGKLSLFVALGIAFVGFAVRARNRRVPSFERALSMLVTGSSCLSAVASLAFDPVTLARCVDAIAPLGALGEGHVAGFSHALGENLKSSGQDKHGRSLERYLELAERLEAKPPIVGMTPAYHEQYRAGLLYAAGTLQKFRDGPETFWLAARLDELGLKLAEISADYLRMSYFLQRGELSLSEDHRQRLEAHAVQAGTAWQVETGEGAIGAIAAWDMEDMVALRRYLELVQRLKTQFPSLALLSGRVRAAHLVLRGKFAEAVALIESQPEGTIVTWGWSRGILARACNGLGDHARARAVCLDALARYSDVERLGIGLLRSLEVELVYAELGLGLLAEARARADALLVQHAAGQGPLTLGGLHEARARVALAEGDAAGYRQHFARMEHWFRPTGTQSLVERVRKLARAGRLLVATDGLNALHSAGAAEAHVLDDLEVALAFSSEQAPTLAQRAERGLQIARRLAEAHHGVLMLSCRGELAVLAHTEDAPPPEQLTSWIKQRIEAELEDERTIATDSGTLSESAAQLELDGMHYRFAPLWALGAHGNTLVGGVALGAKDGLPKAPWPDGLQRVAVSLVDSSV